MLAHVGALKLRVVIPRMMAATARTIPTVNTNLASFGLDFGAMSPPGTGPGTEKIQSTTDAGSLNTIGRNEIEVAPISSALLRIACLVILYKTCRVPDQEPAADGCIRT